MYLINCKTMKLEEFLGSDTPPYAILSHTWGKEEVSFAEFDSAVTSSESKEGYKKIIFTCKQALREKIQYAWVDTCCIDKSSSAELSEAINSMFQWYKSSQACYVYLSDVSTVSLDTDFAKSRWFRRGWTLQELIAPASLTFFDLDGNSFGTKLDHAKWISTITTINESVLTSPHDPRTGFNSHCVARRMSWASDRETTRVEDTAYALLGLFNVNMPLLYGEGERAFIRLQQEIMKVTHDESILAWGLDSNLDESCIVPDNMNKGLSLKTKFSNILARSPKDFKECYGLGYGRFSKSPFMMTNIGLEIELPLVPIRPHEETYVWSPLGINPERIHIVGWIGLLNCRHMTESHLVGIVLKPADEERKGGQVERLSFGNSLSKHTLLVGVGAAATAVPTRITIEEDKRSSSNFELADARHFILNKYCDEPNGIQLRGYDVSTVTASDQNGLPVFVTWDSRTKVLTAVDPEPCGELLCVNFRSHTGFPDFTVLIVGTNAIARKRSLFSSKELSQCHKFLWRQNFHDRDEENPLFVCNGARNFKIRVSINEKWVCHWQIYTVEVDSVNV